MPKGLQPPFYAVRLPTGPSVTLEDRVLMPTYLRLIDAVADGAAWQDIAREVLDLDLALPESKAIYDRHLARARWMVEEGWKQLLAKGLADPRHG